MTTLKPIETHYQGYRFRSRLEARWAVFFDTLGIKWEYEKEGYDLDGVWYLPDFWLPEQDCWIEIKGQEPTDEEAEKAMRLAFYSQKPVYLFFGDVWYPEADITRFFSSHRYGEFTFFLDAQNTPSIPYWVLQPGLFPPDALTCREFINAHRGLSGITQRLQDAFHFVEGTETTKVKNFTPAYWWTECPLCHKVGLCCMGDAVDLPCRCVKEPTLSVKTPRLIAAYTAARSARFEHGERG